MQNDKANRHTAGTRFNRRRAIFSSFFVQNIRTCTRTGVSGFHTTHDRHDNGIIIYNARFEHHMLTQLRRLQTGPLGNKFKSLKIFVYSQKWIFIPINLEKTHEKKNNKKLEQ